MLDEDAKGIPDFWLTTFKNVDMLADMIQVSEFFFTMLLAPKTS